MSARSRNKGANGEREVVRLLREHLPQWEWERSCQSSIRGGLCRPDIYPVEGPTWLWHLEVKRYGERLPGALRTLHARAQADAGEYRAVLVHRLDGEKWQCTWWHEGELVTRSFEQWAEVAR